MSAREQLRADVAMMRELGVLRWVQSTGEIVLGPPPREPVEVREPTAEELRERALRDEERRREILFGASGVRPR